MLNNQIIHTETLNFLNMYLPSIGINSLNNLNLNIQALMDYYIVNQYMPSKANWIKNPFDFLHLSLEVHATGNLAVSPTDVWVNLINSMNPLNQYISQDLTCYERLFHGAIAFYKNSYFLRFACSKDTDNLTYSRELQIHTLNGSDQYTWDFIRETLGINTIMPINIQPTKFSFLQKLTVVFQEVLEKKNETIDSIKDVKEMPGLIEKALEFALEGAHKGDSIMTLSELCMDYSTTYITLKNISLTTHLVLSNAAPLLT